MKKTYMTPVVRTTDFRVENGILINSIDVDSSKSGNGMDSRELEWGIDDWDEEQGW